MGTSAKRILLGVLLEHLLFAEIWCHTNIGKIFLSALIVVVDAFLLANLLACFSSSYLAWQCITSVPGTRRQSCQITKTMLPDNVIFLE